MRMSVRGLLLLTALFTMAGTVYGQKYVNAKDLRIINRLDEDASDPYLRLPAKYHSMVTSELVSNAKATAGMAIHFSTNSSTIYVKYVLKNNAQTTLQAPSGLKGVALYMLHDGRWVHLNSVRPGNQRAQTHTVVEKLTTNDTEYMLYLPTYDGITSFEVGVDVSAYITPGNPEYINSGYKIVGLGTSIMQGGACSHAGLNGTAILSRELNCEVINLAFSGQGHTESKLDEILKDYPSLNCFILDNLPNTTYDQIISSGEKYVQTLLDAHPQAKFVFVAQSLYPYAPYTYGNKEYLESKNREWYNIYHKFYQQYPDQFFFVDAEELDGPDHIGTIDGVHYNDIGFMAWANKLLEVLRPLVPKVSPMVINSHNNGDIDVPLTPTFTWSYPERESVLEICEGTSYNDKQLIYTSAASKNSITVPMYYLKSYTTYTARLKYTLDGFEATTPLVTFTTAGAVPDNASFVTPINGGVLHCDDHITMAPLEGVSTIRIEMSNATTFTPRSSYITNVGVPTFTDSKRGDEIKVNSKLLVDGAKYYARAQVTYRTATGSVVTDYTEPIEFTYSSQAGVGTTGADALKIELKDNASDHPTLVFTGNGTATINVFDASGRSVTTKDVNVAGYNAVTFDEMTSGIYVCVVNTNDGQKRSYKVIHH